MSKRRRNKPAGPRRDEAPAGRPAVSRRVFIAANVVAVLIAAVLIIVPRVTAPDAVPELSESLQAMADGTSLGAPDAPVTITMFTEFQCTVCQAFSLGTEKQVREAYIETGQARFVYKHFVMYGEESMQAALAAEAAAEQNRFWEYHDLLMAERASAQVDGDLSTEKLQSLSEEVGLDMEAFNAGFLAGRHRDTIEQDFEEGRAREVRGTPTFFVSAGKGDDAITLKGEGNISFEKFEALIKQLLEQAGAE